MADRDKPVSDDETAAEPGPAKARAKPPRKYKGTSRKISDAKSGASGKPVARRGTKQMPLADADVPDPSHAEKFAAWLATKDRTWSIVIAVRAALRVLPLTREFQGRGRPDFLLKNFRIDAVSYFAALYPHRSIAVAAEATVGGAYVIIGANAAEAAYFAAREAAAAVYMPAAPVHAAHVVAETAQSVAYFGETLSGEFAGTVIAATASDIWYLRKGFRSDEIARMPLWADWVGDLPHRVMGDPAVAWIRELGDHWHVWADWYADVLTGRQRGEAWDACFVDLDPDDPLPWDDGPKAVNERIAARLAKLKEQEHQRPEPAAEQKTNKLPPDVPRIRPAAIEPVWRDDKLLLAPEPLPADLDPDALAGALAALKDELADLADLAADYPQLDQRPPAYLRQIVDRIPGAALTQAELFRLGHAKEVLDHFRRTVDAEWPDLLAARYHALLLQFDRTARQFPKWRAFIQNAARASLTSDQMEEVPRLVEPIAAELESPDGRAVVDPAIPQVLRNLARPIGLTEQEAEALDAGMDALAVDVLESINNILKSLVEPALGAAVGAGAAMKRYGKGFLKEADKSVERQAKHWGKEVGPALDRLLRRLKKVSVYGGGSVTGGGFLLPRLYQVFPEQFGWLEPVLRFLGLI